MSELVLENEKKLPNGWSQTTMDSISFVITKGSTPTTHGFQYQKTGINFIKTENIVNQWIKHETIDEFISKDAYDYLERSQLKENDILFSIAGTIGRTTIVRKIDLPANTNQAIAIIRCPWEYFNPQYLRIILDSPILFNFFSRKRRGVGMDNISLGDIKELSIPIPPLNEQKRIVEKIDELFSKIESSSKNISQIISQLKQYKSSLIFDAFLGNLTKNWRTENEPIKNVETIINSIFDEKKNYDKKYKKIFHNKIELPHQIPKEWKWVTIGLLSDSMKNGIYKPKSFYGEKGIACLRMYNIEDGNLVWKKIKRMNLSKNEISEYELLPNDLLVNRVNSRELVGKTTVIPKNLEICVFESKNIRLRLYGNYIDSKLVSYWFFVFHQKYFNNNAQQTVGMASINQEQLSDMPFPFMTPEEQIQIVNILDSNISEINHLVKFSESLLNETIHLKNSILKQTFEGKLVPQDPKDESAEILLQKIKQEKEQLKQKEKSKKRKKNGR